MRNGGSEWDIEMIDGEFLLVNLLVSKCQIFV